uniref:Uncharacterized protein n=1 Tax=Pipistrellus kuhlii TaxID=59472 RepID=A0A7J8A7Y7_PIPKU|nr:hypothetical protein mPipKuh1_008969 [Pipistrellus kuhlii]
MKSCFLEMDEHMRVMLVYGKASLSGLIREIPKEEEKMESHPENKSMLGLLQEHGCCQVCSAAPSAHTVSESSWSASGVLLRWLREERKEKVSQTTGQQSSGLGRKGLSDTLGTCPGPPMRRKGDQQALGANGEKKVVPSKPGSFTLPRGIAASGT